MWVCRFTAIKAPRCGVPFHNVALDVNFHKGAWPVFILQRSDVMLLACRPFLSCDALQQRLCKTVEQRKEGEKNPPLSCLENLWSCEPCGLLWLASRGHVNSQRFDNCSVSQLTFFFFFSPRPLYFQMGNSTQTEIV